jgi:hypothetical protein
MLRERLIALKKHALVKKQVSPAECLEARHL